MRVDKTGQDPTGPNTEVEHSLLAHEGSPSGCGAKASFCSRQLSSYHLLVLHPLYIYTSHPEALAGAKLRSTRLDCTSHRSMLANTIYPNMLFKQQLHVSCPSPGACYTHGDCKAWVGCQVTGHCRDIAYVLVVLWVCSLTASC